MGLGVFLTIVSAIVNHYVVSEHQSTIEVHQKRISDVEALIDNLWGNAQFLEGKRDIAILLNAVLPDAEAATAIKKVFKGTKVVLEQQTHHALLTALAQNKSDITDQINDLYTEKISIEQEISTLTERQQLSGIFALVTQILGLILVLSKDLFVVWPPERS